MSSGPPPPPSPPHPHPLPLAPIHPEASFTFRFSMTETQRAPMGHAILPPLSFLDHPYGSTPRLPPPASLDYIPLLSNGHHNSASHYYAPFASDPRHQHHGYYASSSGRGEQYSQAHYSSGKECSAQATYRTPISSMEDNSSRSGGMNHFKSSSRADTRLPQHENPSITHSPTHGPSSHRDHTPPAASTAFAAMNLTLPYRTYHHIESGAGQYEIEVRQQPLAARACGFGERDRRVIDPPPIIQLKLKDNATGESGPTDLRYPFNVVHCTLWSADGKDDETEIPGQDGRTTRRLMGTLVSSPFYGVDEHGQEGCFFCFPDLSCRTHGLYKLRFVLMRLEPNSLEPGQFMPTITETESDIFKVFTAKDFPGMRASTALTKALKQQGCAISVKKGIERSANHGRDDDSNEEEREEARSISGKTKKRRNL